VGSSPSYIVLGVIDGKLSTSSARARPAGVRRYSDRIALHPKGRRPLIGSALGTLGISVPYVLRPNGIRHLEPRPHRTDEEARGWDKSLALPFLKVSRRHTRSAPAAGGFTPRLLFGADARRAIGTLGMKLNHPGSGRPAPTLSAAWRRSHAGTKSAISYLIIVIRADREVRGDPPAP